MSESEYRELEVSKLRHPENALRLEIDDYQLDELCGSIRDIGLQMPILVRPIVDDLWEVVDGDRRLYAVERLKFERVTCRVLAQEENAEAAKLACNLMREDNTDAEIANWLASLIEKHSYNLEQLCAATKRSESWINDRVALLRGYPFVFEALAGRKINFAQAKAINRCKDESWAKMGLHYAICDSLPAARLTEYFVRNAPDVAQPEQPAPSVNTDAPAPEQPAPGIVCQVCGGFKDPQNMVNIWIHRWHWEQVMKIMERGEGQ